ncbi:MAG: DNA-processing protein DprA [Eubacteriales bacterium]|nr:DNA-processing protein DprA [Eubacteriales bacterium]
MKTEMVRFKDSGYPELLKEIQDPPKTLYYRGNLLVLQGHTLAVVGSRKCTPYGLRIARAIGKRAALNHTVLVSGLARGIDSCAQKACLDAGGTVISVMGNGLDCCYPKEHSSLMAEIARTGLLLSEYPDGTEPRRYMFPRRNRIISGISKGVVVVEAGFHSGALKTAEFAAEQGRSVFAVPGNIGSEQSLGTNKLIQDGAEIVTVIGDPFSALGITSFDDRNSASEQTFSAMERKILFLLRDRGEMLPEDIVESTNISPETILQTITILELKGAVYTSSGRVFLNLMQG